MDTPHSQELSSLHRLSPSCFRETLQSLTLQSLLALAENGWELPAVVKVSLSSKLMCQLFMGWSARGLHRKNSPVLHKLGVSEKRYSQLLKQPKMIFRKMQSMEPCTSPSPSSHLQESLSKGATQSMDQHEQSSLQTCQATRASQKWPCVSENGLSIN